MTRNILLSFALLLSACAPHSRAPVAPMNTQTDGAWTVFSAPEWTQNGEAVSVTAIAAATDGALWFGTAGGPAASGTGLYRFDGTNWTRYTTQSGLPADEISSLAAAPDGSLWVATFCCGTARLDKTGGWQYWKAPNDLPENDARAIAVDFQGNPWVGFAETGLARFDGQTWQTFGRGYVGQISPLADGSVLFSISEDSRPLLKRFGRDGWDTLELPSPLKESYIFDVAQTPDGALWFATEKAGLFRLTDGAWRQFTVQDGLPADSVLTLTVASDGSLWCGTPNGIARFDGQTWRVSYADEWVVSAYAAPDGRIWFGGKGEILRYEPSVTSQTSFASPMPVAWQEVTLPCWRACEYRNLRRWAIDSNHFHSANVACRFPCARLVELGGALGDGNSLHIVCGWRNQKSNMGI
ncbi:MAG: hypothetical protein RMJ85_02235 [Anaerolineales bacterium]|nr:hypothetical protein [Anaerolineales bacterium]